MPAVTGGVNQFVVQDKTRIRPPLGRQQGGMKVDYAYFFWS